METKLIFLIGGAVGGFVIGHIFAAMFDVRSKNNPGVPNENIAIVTGIVGAIVGGVVGFGELYT